MSIQREIPTTIPTKCVCGKLPRTYTTDGTHWHLECYPCQNITMRLRSQRVANAEWFRMMSVKRFDMQHTTQPQETMAEGIRA